VITYLECWEVVAKGLFAQALSGEPELVDSLPRPMEAGSFGFAVTLDGEQQGRFMAFVDAAILAAPLLGEGTDQKSAWAELLHEVGEAAAGEWTARTGRTCKVAQFEAVDAASQVSRAFQLRAGDRAWTILVRDEVRPKNLSTESRPDAGTPPSPGDDETGPAASAGVELLLDVELEATLRFGCREMPLLELLELGPGDVVQLDRGVSDPVDLIVGDKIVARGEVVLVNGNFGLRVTEVAAPRKRLESIRCLF
jgi:flagellar motor switch protein FliN/FliY